MQQASKKLCIVIMGLLLTAYSIGQSKKPIDSSVYNNWETIEGPTISSDGKYISYKISKAMFQTDRSVITSADLKWKVELPGNSEYYFTPDARSLVYKDGNNVLTILKLGTSSKEVIPGVSAIRIIEGSPNYLAYTQDHGGKMVVFRNLASGKETKFAGADNFQISTNGKLLVLQGASGAGTRLFTGDPATGATTVIWEGNSPGSITLDQQGRQLVFSTDDNGETKYWYYRNGTDKATVIASNSQVPDTDVQLGHITRFSMDGSRVFISLTEKLGKPMDDPMTVNVWTYMDKKSQVSQLRGDILGGPQEGPPGPVNYSAVLDIASQKIIRLQKAGEDVVDNAIWTRDYGNDDWGLLDFSYEAPGMLYKREMALVNTRDGSRKEITQPGTISPGGKYMVYYDYDKKKFFSYRIADGAVFEISKKINTVWNIGEPGYGSRSYPRALIAGWMQDDKGVLLYDLYDIWQVDLEGNNPMNVTNGFGKRDNNILFFIVEDYIRTPFKGNESIILTGFNPDTKENGFYKITLGKNKDPEKLVMGPYAYSLSRNGSVPNEAHFEPIKAKNAEVYLVHRESETESPNLFLTKDFKSFNQITNVQPQKEYNWYTTELHQFTNPDGTKLQGVLYKPENFDPNKKYPVIFYYYSTLADNLHICLRPEPSDGRLNIPWYVSNGYLVFTPDISHPIFGEVFKGALASIVSAAKYIGSLPYVNPKKLGMQGISWGGIETNYFVTHTDLFAAACSASGLANFISQFNSIDHSNSSHGWYESGTQGSGKTIWETPQWYLENSPVMSANKVTTPLLMFETTKDGACPFVNAFELYNALRRLGKRVWMLEYTEGNHGVWGKEGMDFDLRMQQFFNHFLKDAPAPRWMTEGRPARYKNIENRLELDNKGITFTDK